VTHRFFLSPEAIARGEVSFPPATAHQLRHVLRLRPGAVVVVLDGSGQEYQVELTDLTREGATGRVLLSRENAAEPRVALTLFQGTLKRDRFEWVLQKGTELGVSAFVPVIAGRSVVTSAERIENRRPRWERIVREAAEQCGRGRLPHIAPPLTLSRSLERAAGYDLALILWEETESPGLSATLRQPRGRPERIALWIGPEGGFDGDEVRLAREHGVGEVSLGPRVLRAETAAIAAATIVMSELGQM